MDRSLVWLPDASHTVWKRLAVAMCNGLPVPAGFVVIRSTPEAEIRSAYHELALRDFTHFVAVRGPSHAVLNVIGPDALMHTLRRFWIETPEAAILVQRMVYAMWCGKAQPEKGNLRVSANEGMMLLDPDTYVLDRSGHCMQCALQPEQRKMIRHVDGSAKVVKRDGERLPMPEDLLKKIRELAAGVDTDIGWAIDDLERIWLLSVG